jgi:uncharacterized protein
MFYTQFFSDASLPENLYWFNEPPMWGLSQGLQIRTRGDTDFWQRTHYGFQADSGHCLFTSVDEDFMLTCHVRFQPKTQYDQCGLMARVDKDHWIKVSTEYENARISRLGSVVTNSGYSDWATQDISSDSSERWYRLTREGCDFTIESAEDGVAWKQMRIAHLHGASRKMEAGIYACSPKGEGFDCRFDSLSLTPAIKGTP